MGERTKISFAHRTFSPWVGCTKVSTGCLHCYAEVSTPARAFGVEWGPGNERRRTKDWAGPQRWNRTPWFCSACEKFSALEPQLGTCCPHCGAVHTRDRTRVFFSLGDPWDAEVPVATRLDFFRLIFLTPALDWLLFTKRIVDAHRLLREAAMAVDTAGGNPWSKRLGEAFMFWLHMWAEGKSAPSNVWSIVTMESRDIALDGTLGHGRFRALAQFPAVVRGISAEPLLGPVLPPFQNAPGAIHWIIFGGESHRDRKTARLCVHEWIESGMRHAGSNGVAVFVKQFGSRALVENANLYDWPEGVKLAHGKIEKGAGTGFASAEVLYRHPKGGDPEEWPECFKVFQVPAGVPTEARGVDYSTLVRLG